MRVVVSSTPEHSHLAPLLPLAIECRARGHEVMVAVCPSLGEVATESGLETTPAGIDLDPDRLTAEDLDIEPPPPDMAPEDMNAWAISRVFVDVFAARMAPDLRAVVDDWRPDLMVRDIGEFAGSFVGELAGVPVATVTFGRLVDVDGDLQHAAPELAALRGRLGLPPDPMLAAMRAECVLVPAPRTYATDAEVVPPSTTFVRPLVHDARVDERLPEWVDDLGSRPVVLATLGNIFNHEDTFRVMLDALGDEPYDVVMTVGRAVDPAAFGVPPANVRIARYVPQSLLLPHVDAVVCHGGYNTVIGALQVGVPLVVAPMGADQPGHAERCAALGVGRVVTGAPLDAAGLREATRAVLGEPAYRRAARGIQADIATLPDVRGAVDILERVASS